MHQHEQDPLFDPNETLPKTVRIEVSEPEPAAQIEELPSVEAIYPYPDFEAVTDAQEEQIDRYVESGQFTRQEAEKLVLGHPVRQEKAQPPIRAVNHHPGRRPKQSRRGLSPLDRLVADGPPDHIAKSMRLEPLSTSPIDPEAAKRAKNIVDGDTSDPPSSEIV